MRARHRNASHQPGLPDAERTARLQSALKQHQQGDLTAAAASYQSLLALAPDCADAHHLLGLCLLDQGSPAAALEALQRAVHLARQIAEFHADVAAATAALGRWSDARQALEQATARGLKSADRLHNLGLAHLRQTRTADAIACFELECQLVPRAVAYHNLAVALVQAARWAEAETAVGQAIELKADFLAAYKTRAMLFERQQKLVAACADWKTACELCKTDPQLRGAVARVQMELGDTAAAITTLRAATREFPDQAALWNALGTALQKSGDPEAALPCFQMICALLPRSAEAHLNLANAHARAGHWEAAIAQLSPAEQLDPHHALVHSIRGRCLRELERWEDAEQAMSTAVALQPQDAALRLQLAEIIQHRGDYERGLPHLKMAAELNPQSALAFAKWGLAAKRVGDADAARRAFERLGQLEGSAEARYLRALSLPVIYQDMTDLIERRRQLESEIDGLLADGVRLKPDKTVLNTSFLVAYQGYNDLPIQRKIAQLWEENVVDTGAVRTRARGQRLRVGFLSSLLKYHTVGKLTRGWIKQLDRQRFEVVVLSPYDHEDQGAEWIRGAAEHYVRLPHDVLSAARQTVAQQLDVLIYPEVGMDPVTSALARLRLAPVQCVMWGHPVTTGLPHIDYYLSSKLVEPTNAAEHYSETLVSFATLPSYYYLPPEPNRALSRSDFGVGDEANIYLCPHTLFKMHPDFDAILRTILEQDPRGQIVLIQGRYQHWNSELMTRFARTLGDLRGRVRWLPTQPHPDYLRLLEISDVLLDAPHFGGGNTHYEAFSVGLPVVTRPSGLMRGRVALGLYQKMQLEDCIATKEQQYVELALRIANDKTHARALRSTIRERSRCLYEDQQSVTELENFLDQVCQPARTIARTTSIARSVQQQQRSNASELGRQLRPCTCPACGHHVAVGFFNPGPLPLATLAWPASETEAQQMKRLPHDFVRCVECGHVYNAAFRYGEVPYSSKPNLMFNRGTLWQEHLQKVQALLARDLPERPTVVEIGCGEGHLLRALAAARPDGSYIGFDPNARVDTGGLFEARTELFEPATHLEQCRPDLLISRHVLEHLMNPNGFIQALAFAVSCTGHATRLFIEVPCVDHVFQLGRTVDFFYEHHSHFTTTSLDRMLRRSATTVHLVNTSYSGEVAYALAEFKPREQQLRFAQEATDFAYRAEINRNRVQAQLETLYRSQLRIAIWGGTGKAAAFIQQHGIDCQRFPLVVDSDPEKAGTFVPGSGQCIEYRDRLLSHPVDVIVIATQWRAADIVLEIVRCGIAFQTILLEHNGRLVDYFRDDHPYHAPMHRQPSSGPVLPAPHAIDIGVLSHG